MRICSIGERGRDRGRLSAGRREKQPSCKKIVSGEAFYKKVMWSCSQISRSSLDKQVQWGDGFHIRNSSWSLTLLLALIRLCSQDRVVRVMGKGKTHIFLGFESKGTFPFPFGSEPSFEYQSQRSCHTR